MSSKITINSDPQNFLYSLSETRGKVDERIFKAIEIIKGSADRGDSIKLKQDLSSLKTDIVAKLLETSDDQKFKVIENIIQRLKKTSSSNHLSEVYQGLITCFLEKASLSSISLQEEREYAFITSIFSSESFLKFDEDFRVAFLLQKAETDPEWTCLNIQYYGIRSQEALVDIVKTIARKNGKILSKHIKKIGITSQAALIEIAKTVASQKGYWLLSEIQNYGITSSEALIDIAKILVHNDPMFSAYIGDFHITSQKALIDMVKIAVRDDRVLNFSMYIKDYGILSEEVLIDIAKIEVQRSPQNVCLLIKNYGITSQEALIAIAKKAAEQEGSQISENIQKFGITSQQALIDIAKIAARQVNANFSRFIKNYGITSQKDLISIALIAAEQGDLSLPSRIDDYSITSQEDLVDIAYRVLQKNRYELWTLPRFNLTLENRIALFTRLIHTIPEFGQCANSFFLKEENVQKYPELRANSFVEGDFPIYSFLSDLWEIEKMPSALIFPLLLRCQTLDKEEDAIVKGLKKSLLLLYCGALDLAKGSEALSKEFILLIQQTIEKESNPQVQKYKINTLAGLIMNCRVAGIKEEVLHKQMPLWKAFIDLRDPMLRASLQKYVIEEMRHPKVKDGQKNEWTFASLLLGSFFDQIDPYVELSFKNGKDKIVVASKVYSFSERIEDLLNATKDRESVKSLLRNLIALVETPKFDDTQKAFILRDLLFVKDADLVRKDQFKQLLRSSELVMLLLDYNHEADLLSCTHPRELGNVFSTLFFDTLHIEERNLEAAIFNTFAKWRNPNALLVYARTLDKLPQQEKEKVFPHLQRYVLNVLNGTYYTNRYALDDYASEHLLKMHSEAPELLKKWKKGERFNFDEHQVVDTDNPCDLFLCGSEVGSCQKVDGDPKNSKALVAYLLDPKIRMMVIKNDRGVIMARCMLRLLWDKQAKKFALYQENNYPDPCPLSAMLNEACKKRAAQLNVALVSNKPSLQEVVTLQSFKGKVPFEYVDAGRGVQGNMGYEFTGYVQS